jgi:hypothetical protein
LVDASGTINKRWRTKDFYLAGVHGEFELYRAYTSQSQLTASGSYTVTGQFRTDDMSSTGFIVTGTLDQSLKNAQPHPFFHNRTQVFSMRGAKDDGGAWQELNYLVFVVKGAEELQSAKSS